MSTGDLKRVDNTELRKLKLAGFAAKRRVPEEYEAFRRDLKEDLMTRDAFNALLAEVYEKGGSPEVFCISLERAYEFGIIGRWHYLWLKLLRFLGRSKLNETSGARSVLQIRGTQKMEK